MFCSIYLAKGCTYNNAEDRILLARLGFTLRPGKAVRTRICRWLPPLTGLKVNVDGALAGSPGGIGAIFRDRNGKIILMMA